MADNNLYLTEEDGDINNEKQNKKDSLLNKSLEKFGTNLDEIQDNSYIESVKDAAEGFGDSIKDIFKTKNKRRGDGYDSFIKEDISIANSNEEAISGILNNSFNGNLFDAGVDTLNLIRFGTKWTMIMDQDVDKDIYPFKYWQYLNNVSGDIATETVENKIKFLESLEDPTILGFSTRINFDDSPLFNGVINTNGAETRETALNFIREYTPQHPELSYSENYLTEFTEYLSRIFEMPSALGKEFKSRPFKNHYINSVSGLEKLDNKFVKYSSKDSDHQNIEFTLNEDVRMYVSRLGMLYRDLTWSQNMGKKLIPENLLRFDIYIRISDMRNFVSDVIGERASDGYSRAVYELKDCEFLFPESLNPNTLKIDNESLVEFKLKIKYRRVNRIFYSDLYSMNGSFIIGNKFYIPDKTLTNEDLRAMKLDPKTNTKRPVTSNNIDVEKTIEEQLDNLQKDGLFKTDGTDNAANRFIKSIGNNVVKQGASIASDKLNDVKNTLNDFAPIDLNNNVGDAMKKYLLGNIDEKIDSLGRDTENNAVKEFLSEDDINISESNYNVEAPSKKEKESEYQVEKPDKKEEITDNIIEAPDFIIPENDYDIESPKSEIIEDVNIINEPNSISEETNHIVEAPESIINESDYNVEAPDFKEELPDHKVEAPKDNFTKFIKRNRK